MIATFNFYVENPQEVANLFTFVAVAIIIGYLIAKLRRLEITLDNLRPKHEQPSLHLLNDDVRLCASTNALSVPEKVTRFLIVRPDQLYCDSCVQQSLDMKWRQQVQLVTATLATTGLFKRENAQCSVCSEVKQVTRVRSSPSLQSK